MNKLRIGIDYHFESKIKQGTNTYISELVDAIAQLDTKNEYFLLNAHFKNSTYKNHSNIFKSNIRSNSTKLNVLYGFRDVVTKNRLDILHTNYIIPFRTPCKRIVTIHDVLYTTHKKYFPFKHRLQLKMITPYTVRNADAIIAVSNYSKKQLISHFNIDSSKIKVIYEAANKDFKKLENENLKNEILKKYSIRNNFILFVGRLAPIKNINRMLRVYAEYNKKLINKIDFVIVGSKDPVYPDKKIDLTINTINKNNQNKIILLENLPKNELIKLYNFATMLFFVSYGEGFGLPILEAMSCGLPIITSNVTACPEIAGDAAILVDPANEDEMLRALDMVLNNKRLYEKLRVAGLKRSSQFSWERCAYKTVKLYEDLIKEK